MKLLIVVLLMSVLLVGCGSSATVARRDLGVPVVIDTVIRTEIPLPTYQLHSPMLPTTATIVAPAIMEFAATNSTGRIIARVRVNNRTQSVTVEQEPIQHEYRFVHATIATVRNDTVVASEGSAVVKNVVAWVVWVVLFGVVFACCVVLYKTREV